MEDTKGAADTARIAWSGDVQVVELPSAFALDAREVSIRREGTALILEPIEDEWSGLGRISNEAAAELLAIVEEDVPQQERPDLDDL